MRTFLCKTELPSTNADFFVQNWTSFKKCGLFCAKLDFPQKMRTFLCKIGLPSKNVDFFVQNWTSLKKGEARDCLWSGPVILLET